MLGTANGGDTTFQVLLLSCQSGPKKLIANLETVDITLTVKHKLSFLKKNTQDFDLIVIGNGVNRGKIEALLSEAPQAPKHIVAIPSEPLLYEQIRAARTELTVVERKIADLSYGRTNGGEILVDFDIKIKSLVVVQCYYKTFLAQYKQKEVYGEYLDPGFMQVSIPSQALYVSVKVNFTEAYLLQIGGRSRE